MKTKTEEWKKTTWLNWKKLEKMGISYIVEEEKQC
jgi:hypothetical protein